MQLSCEALTMGRYGGERAGEGQILVSCVRYDREKIPAWCLRRVTQKVLYANGWELTRCGYESGKPAKIRWNPWTRSNEGDELSKTNIDTYCRRQERQKFMVRRASEKIIKSVMVYRAMEREGQKW